MSYSVDLRERVVNYVRNGGSLAAAAKLFQVGRATIYRWLGAPDLQPKPAKERKRKLDKAALAAHVRDFPDALLRERAAHFARDDQRDLGCVEEIGHHQKKRPDILKVVARKESPFCVNCALGLPSTVGKMSFILMRAVSKPPFTGRMAGHLGQQGLW